MENQKHHNVVVDLSEDGKSVNIRKAGSGSLDIEIGEVSITIKDMLKVANNATKISEVRGKINGVIKLHNMIICKLENCADNRFEYTDSQYKAILERLGKSEETLNNLLTRYQDLGL